MVFPGNPISLVFLYHHFWRRSSCCLLFSSLPESTDVGYVLLLSLSRITGSVIRTNRKRRLRPKSVILSVAARSIETAGSIPVELVMLVCTSGSTRSLCFVTKEKCARCGWRQRGIGRWTAACGHRKSRSMLVRCVRMALNSVPAKEVAYISRQQEASPSNRSR